MAKLILTTYPAKREGYGDMLGIIFNGTHPLPQKTVEIRRAADALAELETYKQEAAALGVPLAVTMRIAKGDRSPAGFKALMQPHYHAVNV